MIFLSSFSSGVDMHMIVSLDKKSEPDMSFNNSKDTYIYM